jgi:thymidylate synthase
MKYYKADTFAAAYQAALNDVYYFPEHETSPRDMKIRECTNVQLEFNPRYSLYENDRRSSQFRYIAAELLWYFSGRRDVAFISRFAKFWESLDNGDGTVNSAYGHLLFGDSNEHSYTEWDWLMESLANDSDTRQAVIHFNKPSHKRDGNRDFVCTLSGTFQIRGGKLNLKVHMRSNDMILGTPTDVAFFCLLQEQVLVLLKRVYPALVLGSYVHEVDSLHIYERHFGLVSSMLEQEFYPLELPRIGDNLVSVTGSPNKHILSMISLIESGQALPQYKDHLFNWISTQINTTI